MSFAGSPGALAKPFCLPSSLPRELRGIAAAGGFLFSHSKSEAGESHRDVASTRAAGSAGGRLSGSSLHVLGCLRAGGRLLRCLFGKGHPKSTWELPGSPGACSGRVCSRSSKAALWGRFAGGVLGGTKARDASCWEARRVQAWRAQRGLQQTPDPAVTLMPQAYRRRGVQ